MKGQSAFEMFVSVGIILALIVPVVLFVFSSSNMGLEELSLFQSRVVAQQLSDSINKVYLEGPGAKAIVKVFIPSYTTYLNVSGKQIILKNRGYEIVHPVLPHCLPFVLKDKSGLVSLEVESLGDRVSVSVKQ